MDDTNKPMNDQGQGMPQDQGGTPTPSSQSDMGEENKEETPMQTPVEPGMDQEAPATGGSDQTA